MPTITAESVPDYDAWGPDDYWSCNDWTTWHDALKRKFGKDVANKMWLEAFEKQDSFEHAINFCKYDGAFNSYVRAQGLDAASWWLPNILNDTTTVVENAGDAVVNTSKAVKWIIPSLVIAAAIGVLIYGIKKLNLA